MAGLSAHALARRHDDDEAIMATDELNESIVGSPRHFRPLRPFDIGGRAEVARVCARLCECMGGEQTKLKHNLGKLKQCEQLSPIRSLSQRPSWSRE